MAEEPSVVAAVVANEQEAEMAVDVLRQAGIAAGYRDTEAIEPMEDFIASGPREILVHPDDLDAAKELLAAPGA